METDEWKERTRSVTAPTGTSHGHRSSTDDLIRALREADAAESRLLRKAQPLLAVTAGAFLIVFLIMTFLPVRDVLGSQIDLFGLLTFIFLLQLVLLRKRRRILQRQDYGEPVRIFLSKAQQRYRFMRPTELLYAIPLLLLLGIAGGIFVVDWYARRVQSADHSGTVLAIYVAFFLIVCAAGFFFTFRDWSAAKKDLFVRIGQMRDDLEREESDGLNGAVRKD